MFLYQILLCLTIQLIANYDNLNSFTFIYHLSASDFKTWINKSPWKHEKKKSNVKQQK